jgi:hypothetical protein
MAEYPLAVDTKGSKASVQGDAKVIQVDYSNDESIRRALTGVEVVISTISGEALDVQGKIAAAAKEVDVKLFVPSDFGGITEGATEGLFGAKANIQSQLKALGIPYAVFYTGPFADYIWSSYVIRVLWPFHPINHTVKRFLDLDVTSGKVSVGGDGNGQISFTSRTDIARYVSYVLTQLPPEQLKNRTFTITGENKVRSNSWDSCYGLVVETESKPLNSRSMRYSRHMTKRLGRSCRCLTSPFPNMKPE